MKKTKRKSERFKILSTLSKQTTVENKLTYQAMLMSYEFELGIDFQRRIIKITDEIDSFTFDIVDGALTEMESQGRSDITIKICSPGGSTYHAMAIVGRMKESSCKIITKGYGHVMSAATLILASGTRRRMMSEDAFFMWHESSYELNFDRHSSHKATIEQTEREEIFWAKRMSERSNKTTQWWNKNGIGKDAYFDAQKLLDLDVIDELF